jgi:L-serine/L-threonine ammonia-lyase
MEKGGLLRGVQMGLESVGWLNTKIVAVETLGAASFAAAKQAGAPVKIAKIDTIAKTLGALEVIPSVLISTIDTISFLVEDSAATRACYDFLTDQRMLGKDMIIFLSGITVVY